MMTSRRRSDQPLSAASRPAKVPLQRIFGDETLMLNFLVQHAAYGDSYKRGDQAMVRRLGDAAVARFRGEMGIDLRRLQLGDTGFTPIG